MDATNSLLVLSYLNWNDLFTCSLVCKSWQRFADQDQIWRELTQLGTYEVVQRMVLSDELEEEEFFPFPGFADEDTPKEKTFRLKDCTFPLQGLSDYVTSKPPQTWKQIWHSFGFLCNYRKTKVTPYVQALRLLGETPFPKDVLPLLMKHFRQVIEQPTWHVKVMLNAVLNDYPLLDGYIETLVQIKLNASGPVLTTDDTSEPFQYFNKQLYSPEYDIYANSFLKGIAKLLHHRKPTIDFLRSYYRALPKQSPWKETTSYKAIKLTLISMRDPAMLRELLWRLYVISRDESSMMLDLDNNPKFYTQLEYTCFGYLTKEIMEIERQLGVRGIIQCLTDPNLYDFPVKTEEKLNLTDIQNLCKIATFDVDLAPRLWAIRQIAIDQEIQSLLEDIQVKSLVTKCLIHLITKPIKMKSTYIP